MALAVDTAAGLLYRVVYVFVCLACANAVCEPLKATFLTNSLQVYVSHSVFCNVIVSASGLRYTALQWKSVMFGSCAFFTRAVLVEGTDETGEGEERGRAGARCSPLPYSLLLLFSSSSRSFSLSLSFPHDVSDRRKEITLLSLSCSC